MKIGYEIKITLLTSFILVAILILSSSDAISQIDTTYISRVDGKWDKIDKVSVSCPCTTVVNNLPKTISVKTEVVVNSCSSPILPFTCSTGSGCIWTTYCQSTPINVCFKENITTINGKITINNGAALYIPNTLTINGGAIININTGGDFFVNGSLTNKGYGIPNAIITNNGFFRVSGALSNQGTIQGSGMFFCCGAVTSIGSSVAGYDACYLGDCITWISDPNPLCKGGIPMPIDFIKIYYNQTEHKITWLVNENDGCLFYEVEVSDDGDYFTKIGNIKSTNSNRYEIYYTGVYKYFRIKAYSKNGDFNYSKINAFESILDENIFIYKKDNSIYIHSNNISKCDLNIEVYNITGILLNSIKIDNIDKEIELYKSSEKNDLLIVIIKDSNRTYTKKIY